MSQKELKGLRKFILEREETQREHSSYFDMLKKLCFWTVVLQRTLESPLDCKEMQPVHPKGDQSWVFFGRTDAKAETAPLQLPRPCKQSPGEEWTRLAWAIGSDISRRSCSRIGHQRDSWSRWTGDSGPVVQQNNPSLFCCVFRLFWVKFCVNMWF